MKNDTLMLYKRLRSRIINNEELSDEEWEVFFKIEDETKELRKENSEWHKLLFDSVIFEPAEEKVQATLNSLEGNTAAELFLPEESGNYKKPKSASFGIPEFISDLFMGKKRYAYGFSALAAAVTVFFLILPSGSQLPLADKTGYPQNPASGNTIAESKQMAQPSDEAGSKTVKEDHNLFAAVQQAGSEKTSLDSYDINPYLEEYSSDATRAGSFLVKMDMPAVNAVYHAHNDNQPLSIVFKGSITGVEPNSDAYVMLKIFNNNINSYIEDSPLHKETIPFDPSLETASFRAGINLNLKPGLYYYTVEEIKTDDLIYVGSFRVK